MSVTLMCHSDRLLLYRYVTVNAVDNKLEFPHSYNYDTTVFPKNMNNQTVQVNSRIPMSNLPFSI